MPTLIWNLEWLNHNSQRAYPLADRATRKDVSGDFMLPDDFIVALYLPIHADENIDPAKFFIRSVTVFGVGYSIGVGYDDQDEYPIVASAIIPKATHIENKTYALTGSGDFDNVLGKISIGKLENIDLQPTGQHLFLPDGGLLDPDTIRPVIRGVDSITVVNGTEQSDKIYGPIELVAGRNIQFVTSVIEGRTVIRINAIEGEGLIEQCECDNEIPDLPPIKTINNIQPNPDGNFTLVGDDCTEIQAIANGLKISSSCVTPCCGCAELEKITTDLERFGSDAVTLRNIMNRMQSEVTQFHNVVLGSRLNDSGCFVSE